MKWRAVLAICAIPLCLWEAGAESNFNPAHAFAHGANIGWTHWRPSATDGAAVGEFVCSGYAYGANFGWFNLGNGRPANGVHYQNNSASDFGVNRDQQGRLWGLAYGANIGWINFVTNGAPRVDLRTGKVTGQVYGANVGWIDLGNSDFSLRVDSIAGGLDGDADGIPDGWELKFRTNLGELSRNGDYDQDGISDWFEYLADTNPTNPADHLAILSSSTAASGAISQLSWKSQPTRDYRVLIRRQFGFNTTWADAGLPVLSGDGNPISIILTNQADALHGFFQIEAVRPLMR